MNEYEFTLDDARTALQHLDPSDRELWVRLGMALRSEFGDAAYDVWLDWSQGADSFSERAAKDSWCSFSGSGIGIGTLIKLAVGAGWKPDKQELSDSDRKRLKSERDVRRAERATQEKIEAEYGVALQLSAAELANKTWAALSKTGDSEYLVRKRVQGYGIKYPKQALLLVTHEDPAGPRCELIGGSSQVQAFFKTPEDTRPSFKHLRPGAAVLAMYSGDDDSIRNLQILWKGGAKSFLKGAQKQGCYGLLGLLSGDDPVVICEGYATGATIHEATGWPVVLAFDAGNLRKVCEIWRRKFPERSLIVAGDDDHKTKGNPGATKGREAAEAVGAALLLPVFAGDPSERPENSSDFNDLQISEQIDAVRKQLLGYKTDLNPEPEQQSFDNLSPEWMLKLTKTATGNIKPNPYNLSLVLANDQHWSGVLGFSEFSYSILKLRPPPFPSGAVGEWSDTDTTRLRSWCEQNYGFTPNNADASEVVSAVSQDNSFHEVRDYLGTLKWDHKIRLDSWMAEYLGSELTPYTQLVGSMWLIAAVARVMRYPVKADCVLILEGSQGVGKSTTAAILGGDWFSDTHFHLGDKDGYQQMRGVWICELAELDSFNKAESTRAKSFFSSNSDRYRPPYGRHVVEYPRQCVFIGTTNQDQYLKDVTGNRRYWPVRVEKVDMVGLEAVRDQLWAEALHRFNDGCLWFPQDRDLHLFEAEQDFRFDEDVWTEKIYPFLLDIRRPNGVLMTEIFEEALKMDPAHMKPPEQKRVGQIMARLGWRKSRPRTKSGSRTTGYMPPADWKSKVSAA
ncbi:PriCT-2 domain-containing protein [Porticoccaceae bacterium]|nr:PriCT-2 domain-containing protein [Porticoccaceae bacterium]